MPIYFYSIRDNYATNRTGKHMPGKILVEMRSEIHVQLAQGA